MAGGGSLDIKMHCIYCIPLMMKQRDKLLTFQFCKVDMMIQLDSPLALLHLDMITTSNTLDSKSRKFLCKPE